jgi:hypothetical protein
MLVLYGLCHVNSVDIHRARLVGGRREDPEHARAVKWAEFFKHEFFKWFEEFRSWELLGNGKGNRKVNGTFWEAWAEMSTPRVWLVQEYFVNRKRAGSSHQGSWHCYAVPVGVSGDFEQLEGRLEDWEVAA